MIRRVAISTLLRWRACRGAAAIVAAVLLLVPAPANSQCSGCIIVGGVGSGFSNAFQIGPLKIVTTDSSGLFGSMTATDFNSLFLAPSMSQLNARIASLNADISRSLEIGAIAASMRDAIPNSGDRFAVRLNAAGFNGYAGGSLGVSMNVTDSVRLSANYGRGATQNVVSGGLNVSFR